MERDDLAAIGRRTVGVELRQWRWTFVEHTGGTSPQAVAERFHWILLDVMSCADRLLANAGLRKHTVRGFTPTPGFDSPAGCRRDRRGTKPPRALSTPATTLLGTVTAKSRGVTVRVGSASIHGRDEWAFSMTIVRFPKNDDDRNIPHGEFLAMTLVGTASSANRIAVARPRFRPWSTRRPPTACLVQYGYRPSDQRPSCEDGHSPFPDPSDAWPGRRGGRHTPCVSGNGSAQMRSVFGSFCPPFGGQYAPNSLNKTGPLPGGSRKCSLRQPGVLSRLRRRDAGTTRSACSYPVPWQ